MKISSTLGEIPTVKNLNGFDNYLRSLYRLPDSPSPIEEEVMLSEQSKARRYLTIERPTHFRDEAHIY
jgi:hypothetical protein